MGHKIARVSGIMLIALGAVHCFTPLGHAALSYKYNRIHSLQNILSPTTTRLLARASKTQRLRTPEVQMGLAAAAAGGVGAGTVEAISAAAAPWALSLTASLTHLIPNPLVQDLVCTLVCVVAAALWLKIWTSLAAQGAIDPKLSRKIVHTGSGPLFLLVWPFFSDEISAWIFAALVPLFNCLRLITAAGGVAATANALSSTRFVPESGVPRLFWASPRHDERESSRRGSNKKLEEKRGGGGGGEEDSLVLAISRSGRREEVAQGPLLYSLVLLAGVVFGWRSWIGGLMAITQMAAGDGLADICGRRWGQVKWPWSAQKSIVGTAAFILAAFVVTLGEVLWFNQFGFMPAVNSLLIAKVFAISVACGLVELLPLERYLPGKLGDDNITVPLTAFLLSFYLF